jgi:hypothetical protein
VSIEEIATTLTSLGCPREKAPVMASQLDKRARQLSLETGKPYAEALTHLLKLMAQGWAAQQGSPRRNNDSHD